MANTSTIWRTALRTIMYGKWLSASWQWLPSPQSERFRRLPYGRIIATTNGFPAFRDWMQTEHGTMETLISMSIYVPWSKCLSSSRAYPASTSLPIPGMPTMPYTSFTSNRPSPNPADTETRMRDNMLRTEAA